VKDAIKEKKKNEFADIDAATLNLWKVRHCAVSHVVMLNSQFERSPSVSVAKVRFSPVLPPFLENRELNREFWAGTEQNQNRTGENRFYRFCSVQFSVRTGEPYFKNMC